MEDPIEYLKSFHNVDINECINELIRSHNMNDKLEIISFITLRLKKFKCEDKCKWVESELKNLVNIKLKH